VGQAVFPGQWLDHPPVSHSILLPTFLHHIAASRFAVGRYRAGVDVIIGALLQEWIGAMRQVG